MRERVKSILDMIAGAVLGLVIGLGLMDGKFDWWLLPPVLLGAWFGVGFKGLFKLVALGGILGAIAGAIIGMIISLFNSELSIVEGVIYGVGIGSFSVIFIMGFIWWFSD